MPPAVPPGDDGSGTRASPWLRRGGSPPTPGERTRRRPRTRVRRRPDRTGRARRPPPRPRRASIPAGETRRSAPPVRRPGTPRCRRGRLPNAAPTPRGGRRAGDRSRSATSSSSCSVTRSQSGTFRWSAATVASRSMTRSFPTTFSWSCTATVIPPPADERVRAAWMFGAVNTSIGVLESADASAAGWPSVEARPSARSAIASSRAADTKRSVRRRRPRRSSRPDRRSSSCEPPTESSTVRAVQSGAPSRRGWPSASVYTPLTTIEGTAAGWPSSRRPRTPAKPLASVPSASEARTITGSAGSRTTHDGSSSIRGTRRSARSASWRSSRRISETKPSLPSGVGVTTARRSSGTSTLASLSPTMAMRRPVIPLAARPAAISTIAPASPESTSWTTTPASPRASHRARSTSPSPADAGLQRLLSKMTASNLVAPTEPADAADPPGS